MAAFEAVINNLNDRPMLLVNLAKNQNHCLGLHLIGTSSNRDAIGARATLGSAKRLWVDEVRAAAQAITLRAISDFISDLVPKHTSPIFRFAGQLAR
jgi:hypothetical protein